MWSNQKPFQSRTPSIFQQQNQGKYLQVYKACSCTLVGFHCWPFYNGFRACKCIWNKKIGTIIYAFNSYISFRCANNLLCDNFSKRRHWTQTHLCWNKVTPLQNMVHVEIQQIEGIISWHRFVPMTTIIFEKYACIKLKRNKNMSCLLDYPLTWCIASYFSPSVRVLSSLVQFGYICSRFFAMLEHVFHSFEHVYPIIWCHASTPFVMPQLQLVLFV